MASLNKQNITLRSKNKPLRKHRYRENPQKKQDWIGVGEFFPVIASLWITLSINDILMLMLIAVSIINITPSSFSWSETPLMVWCEIFRRWKMNGWDKWVPKPASSTHTQSLDLWTSLNNVWEKKAQKQINAMQVKQAHFQIQWKKKK